MSYKPVYPPQEFEKWDSKRLVFDIGYAKSTILSICLVLAFIIVSLKNATFLGAHPTPPKEMHNEHNLKHEILLPIVETDDGDQKVIEAPKKARCGKRVIGYYTGFESLDISESQLKNLTHVIFAYIEMSWDGSLSFKDSKTHNRFLDLLKKARKGQTKVLVSIGGEENSQFFAAVTADSRKRRFFIKSLTVFLDDYKLDGVDFYWKRATEKDKWNYISLLRELRQRLDSQKLGSQKQDRLISITVPPAGIENWEMAYDLDQSLEYVNFINVFTMDYYGPWANQWGTPTGPISPMYGGIENRKNFNVDWTMQYYICKARNPYYFNIVIPFFARLWYNVSSPLEKGREIYRNVDLLDNKAQGVPYMSRWTVDQKKIDLSNPSWDQASNSSYIYEPKSRTFLSFETKKSIEEKSKYVVEKNLGGVWIWSVEMDDERNSLMNAIMESEICSMDVDGKERNEVMYNC